MHSQELNDLLYCLGNDRRIVYYHKDRYCLDKLAWHMESIQVTMLPAHALKKSPLHRLAVKPIVRELTCQNPRGELHLAQINNYCPSEFLPVSITFDSWGEGDRNYDQTSRNQKNLVLQINFCNQHNQDYQRLIHPQKGKKPFNFSGHPTRQDKYNTLSWVRIDLDIDTNEALIEEVQNDWLRDAKESYDYVNRRLQRQKQLKPGDIIDGIHCSQQELREYTHEILAPYYPLWAELSLAVAIRFIRDELGITTIYYHNFETGCQIKKISSLPPRSLYTQLPKQFGFRPTTTNPQFLTQDKKAKRYLKAIKQPRWQRLDL